MIISLVIGDSESTTYKFIDGYFFHQYDNRKTENFYFYDSAYMTEKTEKILKNGEKISLVYGNHYKYSNKDTSFSIITVSTKRTMDSLIIGDIRFKPFVDTMSINQYVSKRGEPYYIIYLLKQDCSWQQIDVLMTFLHEEGHRRDKVAGLRTVKDEKEFEANRIRDELLIHYFKLAKTLLNFKVR